VANDPDDFTAGQSADGVGLGLVLADEVGVPESVAVGVTDGVAVVGAGSGVTEVVGRPSRCTGAVTEVAHTASAATRATPTTVEAIASGFCRSQVKSPATRVRIVVPGLDGVGSFTPTD